MSTVYLLSCFLPLHEYFDAGTWCVGVLLTDKKVVATAPVHHEYARPS